ncbi:MAG: C1 family peptidase [Candidatus Zixiibacteriota bacterium]
MKKRTIIGIMFFFILFAFLANTWAGSDQDLEQIKKAIKEKGAKWEAKETSISRLSPDERKKLLGSFRPESPIMEVTESLSGVQLPDSFDWRDYNGYDWTTSIKNQTSCGNCWAYAACGILEAKVKIVLNEPGIHTTSMDLSEMFLTSCSGRGCDLGWDQTSTLNFIKSNGVPDQACFPSSYPPLPYCADTCDSKYLRTIYLQDWERRFLGTVDSNDINTIKDKMMNYGPVSVHLDVYSDFYNYGEGIYEHTYGDYEAGHAVSLVGWGVSGVDSFWIGKNSWGSDWGLDGWFKIRMARSGVGIDQDIWYITSVDSASIPRISVTSPVDGDKWMVETSHTLKWLSPYFSGDVKIEYSTDGGSNWDIITGSTLDDGSYSWMSIPDAPTSNGKIKMSDASDGIPWVLSEGAFYIITLGDVNADGGVGIADVVYLVNYIWRSGPEPYIMEAADVNCNWFVNEADVVFLVNYLFRSGPEPDC